MMKKAYKSELDLNNKQVTSMAGMRGQCVGRTTGASGASDGERYINPKALAAKTRFSADGLKQSNNLAEATAPGFSSGPRRRRGHPRTEFCQKLGF
jgi:hypothetical protein